MDSSTSVLRKLLRLGLPLIPVCVLLVHALLQWGYTSAELWTVRGYAGTLLAGGGLALQEGGVESAGFASLFWVLLVAAVAMDVAAAKALGLVLGAAALFLLPGISRRLAGRPSVQTIDLLAPTLLALHPAMGLHAAGGLGTSLVLALLAATLWVFVWEEQRLARGVRSPVTILSALPMTLLLLSRPEAPMLIGALMAGRALSCATGRRMPGVMWLWFLWPPVCYGLYLLWSYLEFADPISGLFLARQVFDNTRFGDPWAMHVGWRSLLSLWDRWGVTLPLVAVMVAGAAQARGYWQRATILGLVVACLGALLLTGGDATGRRALPAVLASSLLLAAGVEWVTGALLSVSRSRLARLAIGATFVLGLAASPVVAVVRTITDPPPSPFARDGQRAQQVADAFDGLGWHRGQVKILTSSPGALAWIGFRVLDISGQTDPFLRRHLDSRRLDELQKLVFHQLKPDVIIEGGGGPYLRKLYRHPQTRRRYVTNIAIGGEGRRAHLSRRLLIAGTPMPMLDARRRVGAHVWLLGARAMSGSLVLLWYSDINRPPHHAATLGLGKSCTWSVDIGPRHYPMPRWRAGEVVRQVVPTACLTEEGEADLWIQGPGEKRALGKMKTALFRGKRFPDIDGEEGQRDETLCMMDADSGACTTELALGAMTRAQSLYRLGLLEATARQLRLVKRNLRVNFDAAMLRNVKLQAMMSRMATRSYERALTYTRASRWAEASSNLEVAAVADPGSAWISKRLYQTRKRLATGDRLMKELTLDIAQRSLALRPCKAALTRVMEANLALGQPYRVHAAHRYWSGIVGSDVHHKFLLARALLMAGKVPEAAAQNRQGALKPGLPFQPIRRRCPPPYPIEPLFLDMKIQQHLGPEGAAEYTVPVTGGQPKIGRSTSLLAYCPRWAPGSPARVDLYIMQAAKEDLSLDLHYGSRRQRLFIPKGAIRGRRVTAEMELPPATYAMKLRTGHGLTIDMGKLVVGTEANFGFELPKFASWSVEGAAFGHTSALARRGRWRTLTGHIQERYADSYIMGDAALIGTLTSPAFTIRRRHLMMLVAGGDDPGVGVDILIDGKRRRTVRGRSSDDFRQVFVPVARFMGRSARVVIRDDSKGPWGHIAVDGLYQLDGPIPGIAP